MMEVTQKPEYAKVMNSAEIKFTNLNPNDRDVKEDEEDEEEYDYTSDHERHMDTNEYKALLECTHLNEDCIGLISKFVTDFDKIDKETAENKAAFNEVIEELDEKIMGDVYDVWTELESDRAYDRYVEGDDYEGDELDEEEFLIQWRGGFIKRWKEEQDEEEEDDEEDDEE
jgi:hypothetical protein